MSNEFKYDNYDDQPEDTGSPAVKHVTEPDTVKMLTKNQHQETVMDSHSRVSKKSVQNDPSK